MAKKDLFEIAATVSSAKVDAHRDFLDKLQRNGYVIEKQETLEEKGVEHELISSTLQTILKPPRTSFPYVKLEAKQTFGFYDYEEQIFTPLEIPKFDLQAYKKGAELHNFNDRWDKFDLEA